VNIVCIGAHPDDCEVYAGGTSAKWARAGHRVLFVSMTNGDAGHHEMAGAQLAKRRAREAQLSAERGGAKELVLDNHDGELMPTLELRKHVVKIIREMDADIVLTHRPNDYHPDHRYTSQLVADAAFMVTVPNFAPDATALARNPVFLYLMDQFQKPYPFQADIAVDVGDVMDAKWNMLDAMDSQFYEWLPWLDCKLDQVPADTVARREWLMSAWDGFFRQPADGARDALTRWYGPAGRDVEYAELFEICEYGHQPSQDELQRLFPFFPSSAEEA
jgi:LmbE family N-acetylglucosaminyl deacetylase